MGRTIQVSGFPGLPTADVVKNFLENYTGKGTIVALEVKRSKQGSRSYARVQFIHSSYADRIIELASKRLYYGSSYLKAWEWNMDIVQNPRTYIHEMKEMTLNFGCQVAKNRFSILWKSTGVSVKFGRGMKKMYFQLRFNSVDYRLQLSYENIWEIVLYYPHAQSAKLLLIQLFGAPRIYKKINRPLHSFFMEEPDDHWIRTTDFTSSCIGQSSGLVLKIPPGVKIPNFQENFAYYKESDDMLHLEQCVPFSHNLTLVPILHPPRGIDLPYKILFKICSLVQTGCLPGPKIDRDFYQWVDPKRFDIRSIEHTLEKLYYLKECCYEPVNWIRDQYSKYSGPPTSPAIHLDEGLVYIRRVQVTPTKVYFLGPEVNVSNRVLRQYREHIDDFLRVSFVDEEWEKMYSTDLAPKIGGFDVENRRTKIYDRVLFTLSEGITIGDKKFDFLAFSSSQLRDNSVWMFASTDSGLNCDRIREWMGDFRSIKNVAKYAARLGQSFGSSTETLSVPRVEREEIFDITNGTKYTFSDGIGKISYDFAQKVARKCGIKGTPSAFQIRYAGYKGVVAVDLFSSKKLSLRKSMLKYDSDNTKLDVLGWSKYQPCFLNRQIITLLSTLGVPDRVFEKRQREAVSQLDDILVDPTSAQEALDLMAPGENTNILKEMLKCGYKPDKEPFLSMMLQTFRSSKLLDLRVKARIFVPNARQMMGCLDETKTLEYGQVFVQFSGAGSRLVMGENILTNNFNNYNNYIAKGKVVVAKNPCLHPGDVRVLTAIDVPALHHMVDCVVFPQKGMRPHPNECSGSDLDGDIYFVCWDHELIPTKQIMPMDYTPAPTTILDHDVTIQEVEEYFANYIVNDSLGIISNAHTVFADQEPLMAMSEPCIQLAQKFSIAVDFPKTGIPAEIPPHLRVKQYPDFMEKADKTTYESTRVIGKLFRAVKDLAPHTNSAKLFTKEMARKSYDVEMEIDGFKDYIDEAFECKTEYDSKLGNLMESYGIKTEAEILSGSIMKVAKTFDRRKDSEAIGAAVRSLRSETRSLFKKGVESEDDRNAKASAWYHVTYHEDYWGCYNEGLKRDHYLSFPWCVYDKLIYIKKENGRRARRVDLLDRRFSRGLNLR